MQKPWQVIRSYDPEIFQILEAELKRQRHGLEMIASENFASQAVIATMGNICTNKYAEGLPLKRYYGGCTEVDKLEQEITKNQKIVDESPNLKQQVMKKYL